MRKAKIKPKDGWNIATDKAIYTFDGEIDCSCGERFRVFEDQIDKCPGCGREYTAEVLVYESQKYR